MRKAEAYILMVLEGFLTIGLSCEIDISKFLLLLLDHIKGNLDIGDLPVSYARCQIANNSPWSSD